MVLGHSFKVTNYIFRKGRSNSCKITLHFIENQQSRQTGSRNMMGPKTFPMIWGTYMKLVTKYQISAIINC